VIDLHQLRDWIAVVSLFIGTPVLSLRPVQRFLGRQLRRCAAAVWARVRPWCEVECEASAWSTVLQRQRLCTHLERLKGVLATDMSMSATRQIGNRLAYASLLHDLENMPAVFASAPNGGLESARTVPAPTAPTIRISARGAGSTRTVEVLELGWGR